MDAYKKHGSRLLIGAAVLLSAALASVATASEDEVGEPAIPPGREELLAKVVGRDATLPGNCKLFNLLINRRIIDAEYACTAGNVTFELVHPSEAASDDLQTERFAIGAKNGAAPDDLREAIASVVRTEERAFEWIWPAKTADADAEDQYSVSASSQRRPNGQGELCCVPSARRATSLYKPYRRRP
jgi:hypothetical protein